MSIKNNDHNFFGKGLNKKIGDKHFFICKSFDILHGFGYFVHVYDDCSFIGFGYHSSNKFTAIKNSLRNLELFINEYR